MSSFSMASREQETCPGSQPLTGAFPERNTCFNGFQRALCLVQSDFLVEAFDAFDEPHFLSNMTG
jgi:hypothetical protein